MLSSTVAFWRGLWPIAARAQYQMPPPYPAPAYQPQPVQPPPQQASAAAPADNSVGQVATVQGSATVMRANAAVAVLQVSDPIFKDDTLETGANSALGVTFDDETTFSLSADTRIVVNEFVYEDGGSGNAASFNVAIGTAAFVASLVAKTGNMTITTPEAAIGIRGTTGVVEVPAAGGTA
ncbi:MAG: FecR domain-containing protein, partial [Xanthobacteraceae bacterium]